MVHSLDACIALWQRSELKKSETMNEGLLLGLQMEVQGQSTCPNSLPAQAGWEAEQLEQEQVLLWDAGAWRWRLAN